jgi:hypothetical protein
MIRGGNNTRVKAMAGVSGNGHKGPSVLIAIASTRDSTNTFRTVKPSLFNFKTPEKWTLHL